MIAAKKQIVMSGQALSIAIVDLAESIAEIDDQADRARAINDLRCQLGYMADGNWIERIVDTLRVVREVQPLRFDVLDELTDGPGKWLRAKFSAGIETTVGS